jgi:hypothetical protein
MAISVDFVTVPLPLWVAKMAMLFFYSDLYHIVGRDGSNNDVSR